MPRDSRTYITLHDGMPEHPKIEQLDDSAFRALVEMWCWCSRNLTDGFVPQSSWERRVPVALAKQLLDVGLAVATDGGVMMHDYTKHQRTAAEVADLKRKRSEAGKRGGIAKAAKSVASAKASARPVAKQSAKQTASKSLADTDTDIPYGGKAPDVSQGEGANTLVAEWIKGCNQRPPGRVVGQVSKELKGMLDEGIPFESVRAGLVQWSQKAMHPSTLPSFVNEAANANNVRSIGTVRKSGNGESWDLGEWA